MSTRKNHFAAHVLGQIIEASGQSQRNFAIGIGLSPQDITRHLTHERDIRANHLRCYLDAAPEPLRWPLLRAWGRDQLGQEIDAIVPGAGSRIAEPDSESATGKDRALEWLRIEMEDDPELHDFILNFCQRMGWDPEPQPASDRKTPTTYRDPK